MTVIPAEIVSYQRECQKYPLLTSAIILPQSQILLPRDINAHFYHCIGRTLRACRCDKVSINENFRAFSPRMDNPFQHTASTGSLPRSTYAYMFLYNVQPRHSRDQINIVLTLCSSVVSRCNALELFLTCCVPSVQRRENRNFRLMKLCVTRANMLMKQLTGTSWRRM